MTNHLYTLWSAVSVVLRFMELLSKLTNDPIVRDRFLRDDTSRYLVEQRR
jgi:hypothetical protein